METQGKKFVPASKQIPTIDSGWLDRELGEAVPETVRACLTHGRQVEVTVKLKVSPQNTSHGTVKISHDVTAGLPKEKHEDDIVFATPDGNIQADDPVRGKLELRDPSKPEKPLKFAQAR